MGHVILLGDSIFDNQAYVPGQPDVVRQLRAALGGDCRASLFAVDGAVVGSVEAQAARLPGDASHLVVSAGGNDALGASWLLGQKVASVAAGLALLAEAQEAFALRYEAMADRIVALGLPAALCTIYDSRVREPDHRVIRAALALFNDAISRAAFARGLALIDLRLICCEDSDYANPIEPSARGGAKIAAAIAAFVNGRPDAGVIASPRN